MVNVSTKRSLVVSGIPGAGKSTLVARVENATGFRIISAGNMWRSQYEAEYPDGKIPFSEWWGRVTKEANAQMDERILRMAEGGNVIIDARYPFKYLGNSNALIVLVTASLDVRESRAHGKKDYAGMELGQIGKDLLRRENDEAKMSMMLYGKDYRDPQYYHLVLDSGMLSVEEEVAQVMHLLDERSSRG